MDFNLAEVFLKFYKLVNEIDILDANAEKVVKEVAKKYLAEWSEGDLGKLAEVLKGVFDDHKLDETDVPIILKALVENFGKGSFFDPKYIDYMEELLKDGKISNQNIKHVLQKIIEKRIAGSFLDDEFFKNIFDDLAQYLTGEDELCEAVAKSIAIWLASRIKIENADLYTLVSDALNGKIDKQSLMEVLKQWAKQAGNDDFIDILDKITSNKGKLTENEVAGLAVSYMSAKGLINGIGADAAKFLEILKGFNKNDVKGEIIKIIGKVYEGKYGEILVDLIKRFASGKDEITFKLLADSKLAEPLKKKLAKWLLEKSGIEGINDDPKIPELLANAIIELLSGKEPLIAEYDDRKTNRIKSNKRWNVWVKVREVIYEAVLTVKGQAIISTDSEAQPHVFAAARITVDTRIDSLIKKDERELFWMYVNLFMKRRFKQKFIKQPCDWNELNLGLLAHDILMRVYNQLKP
jgi:hypothetical protein